MSSHSQISGLTGAPSVAGTGSGSRGRRNRKSGRGAGNGDKPNTSKPSAQAIVFKGDTPDMNGHVFQCGAEAPNEKQFSNTLDALGAYIMKKMKYPKDMTTLWKKIETPVITKPTNIDPAETDPFIKSFFEKEVASYFTRVQHLDGNLAAAYAIAWGQCSKGMKEKLKALPTFEAKDIDCDLLGF